MLSKFNESKIGESIFSQHKDIEENNQHVILQKVIFQHSRGCGLRKVFSGDNSIDNQVYSCCFACFHSFSMPTTLFPTTNHAG